MYDMKAIINEMEAEVQKELPPYGYSFSKLQVEIAQLKAFDNINTSLHEIVLELQYYNYSEPHN